MSGQNPSDAERRLHAPRRSLGHGDSGQPPVRDTAERRLLSTWRAWNEHPSTRPLAATTLRDRLTGHHARPATPSGLFDRSGYLPGASGRLLGLLRGGAVGEAVAQGRRTAGERSAAILFVLEGLIRAHTRARGGGHGDPVPAALGGLQRWLHAHGVPWPDCIAPGTRSATPDGWLSGSDVLLVTGDGDPAMLTALSRIAAGEAPGTPQRPATRASSASSTPLGALAALWTSDSARAYDLGTEFAALTHGDPDGHVPAGLLAVTMSALLRGRALPEAVRTAIPGSDAEGGTGPLTEALRLDSPRTPNHLPTRADTGTVNSRQTGVDALAIAVRAALSHPGDPGAALRAAANHDGDSATPAVVCGQLLGALHGPTAFEPAALDPAWTRVLERIADDAATEFGTHPSTSTGWFDRYPAFAGAAAGATTSNRDTPERPTRPRFVNSVLGAAVGEALGTPVQAQSWEEIRGQHGDRGLSDYVPAGHPSGRVGSDTQLLLFTVEGMIRADISRRCHGTEDPADHLQHAYQRWLHTQHLSWSRAAGTFLEHTPEPDGWLVRRRALFQTRAPGRTMMRTLIAFAKGQQATGTPANPVSESQGSAAVTRAVGTALWSAEPREAFDVGVTAAALTHGHPHAYLCSGALAVLVAGAVREQPLTEAVQVALRELSRHPGHEEVSRRIGTAVRLSAGAPPEPADIERELGAGWSAPEALGIGLWAALSAGTDFDLGMRLAVNHSGNSPTCAAVCGSLLGALAGPAEHWLEELELSGIIEQLAQDAVRQLGPRPPQEPAWAHRYPST